VLAASIALVQLSAARSGRPSVVAVAASTVLGAMQSAIAATAGGVRGAVETVTGLPGLRESNARLQKRNHELAAENASLREALALQPELAALAGAKTRYPGAVEASAIGYDPENQTRSVTLDRGTRAGIAIDAGVLTDDGVVGRIVEATPLTSTVLLLIDPASKIPAVAQRGRWWGIATGTGTRVRLQYVSQDARLLAGDLIVTGAGRSFRAGVPLGRVVAVDHREGALYQTALVEPAVELGRVAHVLVLPH